MAEELNLTNASVFMAQETNTAWKPTMLASIQAQCHCVQCHHTLTVLSSQDGSGGSARRHAYTRWASHIIGHGTNDPLG